MFELGPTFTPHQLLVSDVFKVVVGTAATGYGLNAIGKAIGGRTGAKISGVGKSLGIFALVFFIFVVFIVAIIMTVGAIYKILNSWALLALTIGLLTAAYIAARMYSGG